jgi:hypothetical protein
MLFIPDWYDQNIDWILGLIFLCGAMVSTGTGTTLARGAGWVYRAKNPSAFRWVVAIYYVAGVAFIGRYLLS